jgi:hypothetical protein
MIFDFSEAIDVSSILINIRARSIPNLSRTPHATLQALLTVFCVIFHALEREIYFKSSTLVNDGDLGGKVLEVDQFKKFHQTGTILVTP